MKIGSNLPSLTAATSLSRSTSVVDDALSHLASGLRINSAADDAAGLAIADHMQTQRRGLSQAQRGTLDGVSMVQVADGALGSVQDILGRMTELAVQAGNGALSGSDRSAIASELSSLKEEFNRIGKSTSFNGSPLLQGADGAPSQPRNVRIQVGPNSGDAVDLTFDRIDVSPDGLKELDTALTKFSASSSASNAGALLDALSGAGKRVGAARSSFGAALNRLDVVTAGQSDSEAALAASESRIRDADMAAESSTLASARVVQQSNIAVLAQTNGLSERSLALLK